MAKRKSHKQAEASGARDVDATDKSVERRAYEIFQSRSGSGVHGCPVSDWLRAERELQRGLGSARHGR